MSKVNVIDLLTEAFANQVGEAIKYHVGEFLADFNNQLGESLEVELSIGDADGEIVTRQAFSLELKPELLESLAAIARLPETLRVEIAAQLLNKCMGV